MIVIMAILVCLEVLVVDSIFNILYFLKCGEALMYDPLGLYFNGYTKT